MMNKSLRAGSAESSDKRGYGFRASFPGMQLGGYSCFDANRHPLRSKPLCAKKEPPETGGFES
jgi:hypothetical protein